MAKKKETQVIHDPMVTVIEVKKPYISEQLLEFGKNMADAINTINERRVELKNYSDEIKGQIAVQEDILADNASKIHKGYEMSSVQCVVTYSEDGKSATFTDKETGEIVEQRDLTEEEQLRLSSQWKDAEQIIRKDNEVNG